MTFVPPPQSIRPANRGRRRLLCASALTTLLAGCGFQLRGSSSLPYATLWIGAPTSSAFANELRRQLRSGSSTAVVDDAPKAQARFELLNEDRSKEILSLNSAGRVREYELRYSVRFRVHDGLGRNYIADTTLFAKREISFNESAILASEAEELLLYRDMQTDLIQQILRRMSASRQLS